MPEMSAPTPKAPDGEPSPAARRTDGHRDRDQCWSKWKREGMQDFQANDPRGTRSLLRTAAEGRGDLSRTRPEFR
jgi:hypothetical protein